MGYLLRRIFGLTTNKRRADARRGEVKVEGVDRLFVLANLVPLDRGDNVKKPAPTTPDARAPDTLFRRPSTLVPNEKL